MYIVKVQLICVLFKHAYVTTV